MESERASRVLRLRTPPRAPAHLSAGSQRVGEGRGVRDAEEERREKEGVQRGLRPPELRAGAVAATAGRGRQHGGVSGGVGASQQQRRRWQRPELWPPRRRAEGCARRGSIPAGAGPVAASRGQPLQRAPKRSARRSVRQALRRTVRAAGRQLRQCVRRLVRRAPKRPLVEAFPGGDRRGAPHGCRAPAEARTGAGPAPRRWWMLGLRGAGRGAGAAAGITEPAEAARRRCTAPQQRGGWRATSRARGSSRSPSRSWPSGPAAVEAAEAPWGSLGGRPAPAPARWCCRRG